MPCVKRLNRFRIVPSLGNRFIPKSACKARSARSIELCANRLAPATTATRNAVKVSPAGIALLDFRHTGMSRLTRSGKPIPFKNSMSTLSPPNGVTARGVCRKTTFFSPQSALTFRCTVLFLRRWLLTNSKLTDWNGTVPFNLRIQDYWGVHFEVHIRTRIGVNGPNRAIVSR